MSRTARWDAVALQEVGRHEEVDDIAGVTPAGHWFFLAPRHAAGTRCTGVAVHARWAHHVSTVYHAPRLSKVALKATQGAQDNNALITLISVHAPSEIGHTQEELDDLLRTLEREMPGKRGITMFGGDLNATLCDQLPSNTDPCIGAALRRDEDQHRPSTT